SIAWRKANRGRALEARKAWMKVNRLTENARSRAYKLANPEKAKAAVVRWIKSNPDKKHEHDHRYRARKTNATVRDFTAEQWRDLVEQYGHRCAYCGLKHDKLQQDHVQ